MANDSEKLIIHEKETLCDFEKLKEKELFNDNDVYEFYDDDEIDFAELNFIIGYNAASP